MAQDSHQVTPETVATFDGPMPTGVTVSKTGRIFVNFPRWGDDVEFTVAELVEGKAKPFPSAEFNRLNRSKPADGLVSVQSVVVDSADRLWLLDTGSIEFGPPLTGGPKLIAVDLTTNKVVQTISFPDTVALKTSYLNDVRFSLDQGEAGFALITDSSSTGPNAIIVVDLATGKSTRRLNDHPSTKADDKFLPWVEGQPLMNRPAGEKAKPMTVGADGIAISPDGKVLYYSVLSSRQLYQIPTDLLIDTSIKDRELAMSVKSLGDRGFASDGLAIGPDGRLFLTNYEDSAIVARTHDGEYQTIARGPDLLWPDTLALSRDGYLYFTANQLHRQAGFHNGNDLRKKPYVLFRISVDGMQFDVGQ